MNFRLRRSGYKLLYTPETSVCHHKRSTFASFVRQMFDYGIARGRLTKKYPDSFWIVFLLPSAFVLLTAIAVGATILGYLDSRYLFAAVCLFMVASFVSSVAARGGLLGVVISPLLYSVIYISYGLGFLRGLLAQRSNQIT